MARRAFTVLATRLPARRLAPALALGAIVMAMAPAMSAAADTSPGPEYALNVQTLLRGGSGGEFAHDRWPLFLDQAAAAGVHAARFEALWSWAEAGKPQGGSHTYDWTRQDEAVGALARAGMRWKAVLSFLPGWAHGPNDSGFPAQYHDDFAAFAAAVASRYGPRGQFWTEHPELTPLPVSEYEVWTEPNSSNYWQPTPDSAEYWGVYAQLRSAIKAVDPAAEVLVSLGWQEFEGFLGGMRTAAGSAWAIDGVAFHPYAPTPLGIVSLVRRLRIELRAAGSPAAPIHVWEIGWPRAPAGSPGVAHSWDPGRVTDETRAANLTFASDALLRSDCGVPDVAAYSIAETQADRESWEQWFGLYDADGGSTATIRTWSASIGRLQVESPRIRLALCRDDDSAAASGPVLPLVLAATVTSPGCVRANVAYHGHPLEEVSVTYRTAVGTEGGANTDTSGIAEICVPSGERDAKFDLAASVARIAAAPALRCTATACHVARRAAPVHCAHPRILAPRRASRAAGRVRIAVGLACGPKAVPGRRLRVYGVSVTGGRRVLRTVRTRSRRVRMTVAPARGYGRALVVSFQGVRALQFGAASARVALEP